MRISDWSSDVCSSDLLEFYFNRAIMAHQHGASHVGGKSVGDQCAGGGVSRPRTGTGGARSARSGPPPDGTGRPPCHARSEEHTSELQSLMRISYAVFCLKKKHTKHILIK